MFSVIYRILIVAKPTQIFFLGMMISGHDRFVGRKSADPIIMMAA